MGERIGEEGKEYLIFNNSLYFTSAFLVFPTTCKMVTSWFSLHSRCRIEGLRRENGRGDW